MENNVTVILNGYRRPHALQAQMAALKRQTIKPSNVMFWQNGVEEDYPFDYSLLKGCITSVNSQNFGVWARFAYALNADTKYVCIFDDDTIPGAKWLENCLSTIKEREGLLGTIGVIFNDLDYVNFHRHGWANPNEEAVKVDIVGHSWFFKREWLGAFWSEAPLPENTLCGEDMHFSYAIQKHLGLSTYVPPHPRSDMEMWGSHPVYAQKLGVDKNAISCSGLSFGGALKSTVEKGFKLINI